MCVHDPQICVGFGWLIFAQYSAVMGLNQDLNLKGNDFSNVATFLFVGLLCFEIPNSMFSHH